MSLEVSTTSVESCRTYEFSHCLDLKSFDPLQKPTERELECLLSLDVGTMKVSANKYISFEVLALRQAKLAQSCIKIIKEFRRILSHTHETLPHSTGCCSVTQSRPTPRDPMDCSTPGFPVLHYLPEFAQVHVHWVGDAIQPSHPLLRYMLVLEKIVFKLQKKIFRLKMYFW